LNVGDLALAGTTLYIVDRPVHGGVRIRTVVPAIPPTLPQPPKITQVGNAVDYQATYSPGALVTILGNYLAPQSPAFAQFGQDGRVTTTLAGDVVIFSGTAGPLLYVSAGQINTVVPYKVAPDFKDTTLMVQTGAGTDMSSLRVMETSVAIFPGLVLNPDGTLNSAMNPAPKGATLVMYGTGMGQTNPAGVDGAILQGPHLPVPIAKFSATVTLHGIALFPAEISYLGPLPGAVAGAMQVNVRIPDSVPGGISSLSLVSFTGSFTQDQNIYILSDPPVLTSMTPPPPLSQTPGSGNFFTLNGTNLSYVAAVNFYLGVEPISLRSYVQDCNATQCRAFADFAGQAGDYSVEVVNLAHQVSNRFTFTVLPLPPPKISAVTSLDGLPIHP